MIKASHILKLGQSYLPRERKDQEEKSSAIRKFDLSPKSFQRRLDNRMEDDHYWESFFEPTEKGKTSKVKEMAANLHLDLYNFEEAAAQQSRYVLTSPRSLEACSRFGIKPVELLHKSFEEFVDEFKSLYDTDYSHRAVHEVFQEHERQRLRKLKLCRDERERIMRERNTEAGLHNEDRKHLTRSPIRGTDFHVAERDVSSFTRGKNSSLEEEEIKERSDWRSSLRESQSYSRFDYMELLFSILLSIF